VSTQTSVASLVKEYRSLLGCARIEAPDSITELLVQGSDWTPLAAEHLFQLAENYGSFMLRNALAISIALEIEDGALGF